MAIGFTVGDHIVMAVTAAVLVEINRSVTEATGGESVRGMTNRAILAGRQMTHGRDTNRA